jgi:hypothetical protein
MNKVLKPTNRIEYLVGNGRPDEIQFSFEDVQSNSPAYKEWMSNLLETPIEFLQKYSPYYNKDIRMTREEATIEHRKTVAKLYGEEKARIIVP